MAVGYIDKDFIEEGPFELTVYNLQMDDPSSLVNVRLWFAPLQKESPSALLGRAVEKTDADGNVIYVFNPNSQRVKKQLDDGSIETTTDDQGNTVDKEYSLRPDAVHRAWVTAEINVLALPFVVARAEIEVRPTAPLVYKRKSFIY